MQKNEFELNKKQLNLRLALTESIRTFIEERNLTRQELKQVLKSLELAFNDYRFSDTEINESDLSRDEQQQFYDAVFNIKKGN